MSRSGLPTGTMTRRQLASFGAVRGTTFWRTCGLRAPSGTSLATGWTTWGFVVLGKCSLDSFSLFPLAAKPLEFFSADPVSEPRPASLSLPQGRGALLCSTPRFEPLRPERDPEVENARPKRP